jgi:hypothetical protein
VYASIGLEKDPIFVKMAENAIRALATLDCGEKRLVLLQIAEEVGAHAHHHPQA